MTVHGPLQCPMQLRAHTQMCWCAHISAVSFEAEAALCVVTHDKGKATVTQTGAPGGETKVCEHYAWKDGLIVVPFEESTCG